MNVRTVSMTAAIVMGFIAYASFDGLEGPAAASAMALPLTAAFAFFILGT